MAAGVDVEKHRNGQAVDIGHQAREMRRERFRQHGDAATREVHARAALERFLIERAAGTYVIRDVRDRDRHAKAAVDAFDRHGVVVIARVRPRSMVAVSVPRRSRRPASACSFGSEKPRASRSVAVSKREGTPWLERGLDLRPARRRSGRGGPSTRTTGPFQDVGVFMIVPRPSGPGALRRRLVERADVAGVPARGDEHGTEMLAGIFEAANQNRGLALDDLLNRPAT